MNKSKICLDEIVKRKTIVREMFDELVRYESMREWDALKKKHKDKFENKIKKTKNKNEPDAIDGVVVGDEALKQYVGGVVNWNEKNVTIYDNIKLNQAENDLLSIPPDHQIFPRISSHEVAVEAEKCMIKSVWEKTRGEISQEKKFCALEGVENSKIRT